MPPPHLILNLSKLAQGNGFSVVQHSTVSQSVRVLACCPTMDLVALSTTHQLVVYRALVFKTLWSHPVSSLKPLTALCWHPDGKSLAIGHASGEILMLGVEDGQVLSKVAGISATEGASGAGEGCCGR